MEEAVEYNAGKPKGKPEEERILIHKTKPECKFRELHETTAGGHTWVDFMCGKSTVKKLECDEKCFEQCEWKELIGLSKQEAIERMAKEMARLRCPEKPTKGEFESIWKYELLESTQKNFKELAQAALEALLGDQ